MSECHSEHQLYFDASSWFRIEGTQEPGHIGMIDVWHWQAGSGFHSFALDIFDAVPLRSTQPDVATNKASQAPSDE